MSIKDIDNKIAAIVLRRQQEIEMEHSARLITENLKEQEVPDVIIKKTVDLCHEIQQEQMPQLNAIVHELEVGNVNFDDTALAMMEFTVKMSQENGERISSLMIDALENGDLNEFIEAIELKDAEEDAEEDQEEDQEDGTND